MNPFLFHLGFMAISAFIILLGIIIVKTPSLRRRYFMRHRTAGLAGTAGAFFGFGAAVWMVAAGGGNHFDAPHTWLGAIALFGMVGSSALGLSVFRWKTKARKLRNIHKWAGWLTALFLTATVVTGLTHAGII